MIELERTYLAKYLPMGLENCDRREVVDIYIPKSDAHPKLRIRKNGDKLEMTKKEPIETGDASRQSEQTIVLTEAEFETLNGLDGKRVRKLRYFYKIDDRTAEIDIFKDFLEGLVLVDFEFDSLQEKEKFIMPDFCLVEVTQETFAAGGMLCGKDYKDIEEDLKRFGYQKIIS